ncbi:hypothetical protein GCM10027258_59760 [Amycolatopsis stemonae]
MTHKRRPPTSSKVITAVAGKITIAKLTELCDVLQEKATDAMIGLLEHYARAADPSVERTGRRPDDEFALASEGMNSTRGVAAATIGEVLFAQETYVPQLLPTVEKLAQDPILSVRAEATRPVSALFKSHLEQALDIADALFATSDIEIHLSNHANELLLYAVFRAGPRFSRHLDRALEADSPIAVRSGHIWANALLNDRLPEACISDVTDLPILARRGAAQTIRRRGRRCPQSRRRSDQRTRRGGIRGQPSFLGPLR